MAEIGLVPFARVALQVSQTVVPEYRTGRARRVFTQPQLRTILCLMRCEDRTLRETDVWSAEHRELRAALRLRRIPDSTTFYRFMRRLSLKCGIEYWRRPRKSSRTLARVCN